MKRSLFPQHLPLKWNLERDWYSLSLSLSLPLSFFVIYTYKKKFLWYRLRFGLVMMNNQSYSIDWSSPVALKVVNFEICGLVSVQDHGENKKIQWLMLQARIWSYLANELFVKQIAESWTCKKEKLLIFGTKLVC